MPPRWQKGIVRAKTLRRDQTLAEEALWRDLRGRRAGAKFRRQVPIGPFVVDFACLEARLVVEVDGPSHGTPGGIAQDAGRDAWLKREGWRVVRVTNAEVFGALALGVVEEAMQGGSFSRLDGRRRPAQPDG